MFFHWQSLSNGLILDLGDTYNADERDKSMKNVTN